MSQDPNTPHDPLAGNSDPAPAPAPKPQQSHEPSPLIPQPLMPVAPPAPAPEAPKPATPAPEPKPEAPAQAGAPAAPALSQEPPAIDLDKILLPKKDTPGHTPESAQRINAGALLEQEMRAAQEGLPKAEHAAAPPPETSQPPKPETPLVAPLETYQSDIEKVVHDKNISMVSIAAAEAQRRGSQPQETVGDAAGEKKATVRTSLMVAAGVVFVAAAAGTLAVALWPKAPPAPAPSAPLSTIIATDGAQTIVAAPGTTRDTLMTNLEAAKEQTALSLGLISRLWVATPTTTAQGNTLEEVGPQTLLYILAPQIPQALLRTIEPNFLLGVHVYDGNQALFVFKVDSYEQAYAGMLEWETTMPHELAPLFSYTPPPHIPEQGGATTTTAGPQITGQTAFVDRVVENHDARVIEDPYGNILLLWTFLDKQTLVITTNAATLREIISRITQAPVVTQP